MIHKLIIFLSILIIILNCFCCKSESSAPTTSGQLHFEIDTTFLSWEDSIWAIGGPGFYYKPITIQNYQFNPLWGDSVVKMLLDSNFFLIEFWYPANGGICRDPYMKHARNFQTQSTRHGDLSLWL